MKSKPNYKIVSPEEFNEIKEELDYAKVPYDKEHNACYVQITTPGNIYSCSLTGENKDVLVPGTLAQAFYKKSNLHYIKDQYGYEEYQTYTGKTKIRWDYKVASGYQYFDEYYARKPLKCWSYDINSAYPYAMLCPMPDTRQEPRYNDVVKKGEIGFYKSGGATTDEGDYAEIIFPLMDSPFKRYVYEKYALKKVSEGIERNKYKMELNYTTGLVAKRNIFIRNAIIYYSNKYIKKYIDDDTVYCNIDCIVSLRPRNDLPIGDEIGMFKQEHECDDFKYIKSGIYQWGNECHYSGIPTGTITDIEHIDDWYNHLKYKYVNGKVILNEEK